jgi:endonuclease G
MRKSVFILIAVFSFGMTLFSQTKQTNVNYASPKPTKKDAILPHEGFTISYNAENKNANWVSYRLVGKEVAWKITRKGNFKKDPLYPNSATDNDYYKSGYDRGHLFPAGSSWTNKIMEESFYYTNISPQNPSLNRGKWKEIEETVRKWASDYDTVYVVTGTVFSKDSKKIGNAVKIPEYFFKLVLVYTTNKQQAIVFFCENSNKNNNIQEYAISVDELENKTGLDFCTSLDKNTEEKLEKAINLKNWNWGKTK